MYSVEYINCKICGRDEPKIQGIRGNREYMGAEIIGNCQQHMATNVVRCQKCGFVYTNPLIIAKVKAYSDPEDYLPSSRAGSQRLFEFNLNLIERYTQKAKILDIGCGKGEFLSAAKQRGWEVFGLESSSEFAKFASANYDLNINSASLEDAGYPDNFFEVVVLNMVLEHIDNPKDLIIEINRILKNKGLLFIEVPNMDSLMLKIATLYFRLKGKDWSPLLSPLHHPFHCYGYNVSSIRYLLDAHDFQIKKIIVRDSSLRGFRPDTGGGAFEKFGRFFFTRLAGLIGRGDVLMVLAHKETIK